MTFYGKSVLIELKGGVLMTEIAKNIKRFRNAKKMTQEELALKINVTRQAVSNWENNKTQPDIETLTNISNALEIGIEELIYGKKYIKNDESKLNEQKISVIKIILAVFGAVLIAIGAVIVFFNYWEAFPQILKLTFTLLPLFCAQGFAAFVLTKKGERVLWRECAGTILIIAVVSTVALVNSALDIHCGVENCLVIDALLCLPIIFIFDSVTPLIVLLGFSAALSFYNFTLISGIIVSLCFVYVILNGKNIFDMRFKLSAWFVIAACVIFTYGTVSGGSDNDRALFLPVTLMLPFVLGVVTVGEESLFSKPLNVLSLLSGAVALSVFTYVFNDFSIIDESYNLKLFFASLLICLAVFSVLAVGKIKSCGGRKNAVILSAVSVVLWILCMVFTITSKKPGAADSAYTATIFASAFGVSKIIEGIGKIKLLPINTGLIIIFVQMFYLLQAMDADALLIGIMLIVFGTVLLTVNTVMVRKTAKAQRELQEVDSNEKEC